MRAFLRELMWPVIRFIMRVIGLNPLTFAHSEMGIMESDIEKNGEAFLLEQLPQSDNQDWVFFDVGANIGKYSTLIKKHFPNATVHAFEPNPAAYEFLIKVPDINHYNLGLGTKKESLPLYTPFESKSGSHSSLVPESLIWGKAEHIQEVRLDTLAHYFNELNLTHIDFMKMDVEGYEIDVLLGAGELIEKIRFIQFEFNHHLIFRKMYLLDFYTILSNFDFYRITPRGLKQLASYEPVNEIFLMQNILAVNKSLVGKPELSFLKFRKS
jgi:FkbM family methyltransferase